MAGEYGSRVAGTGGVEDRPAGPRAQGGCLRSDSATREQPEPGGFRLTYYMRKHASPLRLNRPMNNNRIASVRQRPHQSIPPAHRGVRLGAKHVLTSLLLVSGVFAVSPAQAQITGYVLNEEGDPVAGAAVEAWAADRKIGGRLANEDGWFLFPAGVAQSIRALYAGQLGYHPEVVQIEEGVDAYEIRLTREPIPLPELVVDARRDRCAGGEERDARRLWELAAERYSQSLDTMGVATYLASVETILPEGEVGTVQAAGEAIAQRGSSSLLRFSWQRRIEREGYAYQIRRSTPEQSYTSLGLSSPGGRFRDTFRGRNSSATCIASALTRPTSPTGRRA